MSQEQVETIWKDFRLDLQASVEEILLSVFGELSSKLQLPSENGGITKNMEKTIMTAISTELSETVIPMAESLARTIESAAKAKLASIESKAEKQRKDSLEAYARAVETKLLDLETKINSLKNLSIPSVNTLPQMNIAQRDPYVELEALIKVGNWDIALSRAVSIANGMNLVCQELQDKFPVAEDFTSQCSITDPVLSLQICVCLAHELVQSDKMAGYKLDMIYELVLGLNNPEKVSIANYFNQLKSLLTQLQGLVQSNTGLNNRVREILKIINATERLTTPGASVISSPARYM